MACSSLGVVGPGVDDGKELAIFSSGIAMGTRSTASWELTSCSLDWDLAEPPVA